MQERTTERKESVGMDVEKKKIVANPGKVIWVSGRRLEERCEKGLAA